MKLENESAPQARRKNRVSGGEFRDLRGTWSGGGPPGWGGIRVHLGILELVSRNSGNLSTMSGCPPENVSRAGSRPEATDFAYKFRLCWD